jgi:predicted cupin superfamily sugar epimerase
MLNSVLALIDRLELQPHPEGGFFRETYRGSEQLTGLPGRGVRSVSTAILFLLPHGHISALHRIRSDEVWHFYDGSPLCVVEITCDGTRRNHRLGAPSQGENCQADVRTFP